MITLYDLGPIKTPKEWGMSPFVRKVMFTLNYKKLPFELIHLPLDELEPKAKSLGALPTKHIDGSSKYTVPIIHDSHTGKVLSDSFPIAEYLDEAYPDTPKVIPPGTRALQKIFIDTVLPKFGPMVALYLDRMIDYNASPVIQVALAKRFGAFPAQLTDEQRAETWKKVEASFNELESAYGTAGGVFVSGDKPIFVDFSLAALFAGIKLSFGEESEEWKRTSKWIGGRVGKVVEAAMKHERA
ncbi:hypothetical protein V5O48_013406 [Marasmius crinis-equi]|uniref:GST N-terminal domain-containing protein n=1 Tax=Marasmius crinis-equi TaxID=585013 RepID=A0ABR3F058_9AGAR